MHSYKVIFFTGSLSWAGTNANVDLTLYGSEGESNMLLFRNKGDKTFESGMRNLFTVKTKKSVGSLYRVRVGHDNAGMMPAWFLEKILIQDEATGIYYEFSCYKWFDSATGDLRIRRYIRHTRDFVQSDALYMVEQEESEIEKSPEVVLEYDPDNPEDPVAPETEEVSESIPEPEILESEEVLESAPIEFPEEEENTQPANYNYTITFYTGSVAFSGTDANVYASLHGAEDQPSEDFLFVNRGNRTFEKGGTNSYPIDSKISLDNVSKLSVGHDNKGIFPGWYLATVELKDNNTNQKITFHCHRWIWSFSLFTPVHCDLTREDAVDSLPLEVLRSPAIARKAVNAASPTPALSSYTIHLVSEVSYGSLGDDKIVFTLYGKNGKSEEQNFDQQENIVFEKRMRGTMQLDCQNDLGSIEKIRIGLESSKGQMPWILVVVIDNKMNDSTVFMCDCCLVNGKSSPAQHDHFPVFTGAMNDVFALDKDQGKEWTLVKGTSDVVVWTRDDTSPKRPPIIKARLTLDDVPCPYRTAVKHFTDWEERKRWDKTFEAVKVLEKIGDFTLVQCTLKLPFYAANREMVLACLDRSDQRYHIQVMRNALHPRVLFNNKQIRAELLKSGTIVYKLDLNEDHQTKITIISQTELGGWMQSRVKKSYLTETPFKQIEYLKTYLSQRKPSTQNAKDRDTGKTQTTSLDDSREETEMGVTDGITKRRQEAPDLSYTNDFQPTTGQREKTKLQELSFDTIDGGQDSQKFSGEKQNVSYSTSSRITFTSSKTENGINSKNDAKMTEENEETTVVKETQSVQESSGNKITRIFSRKTSYPQSGSETTPHSNHSSQDKLTSGGEPKSVSSFVETRNSRNSSWRSSAENGKAQENFKKMNDVDQDQHADNSGNRFFRDSKLIQWLTIR